MVINDTTSVPVFPGRTNVKAQVPAHLGVSSWNGTLAGGQRGDVTLRVGISQAGDAAVQKAVLTSLDRCERSTVLEPAGCPLGYSAYWITASDVRWTYTPKTRRSWATEVDDDGSVRVSGTAEGTVSYTYTPSYAPSRQPSTDSDSGRASYRGTITFDGDGGATFRMGS
ncbi:hypothetical protein ACUN7V_15780 [Quadrisphaera oryzae]|uniref:hypothetical protein n=1 Tax=Quadrisphaera TaxID=317661 RepID=UPI0016490722|nr:hypothetical protein [Quadrisphaera sp. RL12-1S]MBC3764173.1 hypothetical protein [Quadrisphaera sp. RL12-1S]